MSLNKPAQSYQSIVVIGSSGTLGCALLKHLANMHPTAKLHGLSRKAPTHPLTNVHYGHIDYHDEHSIEKAAQSCIIAPDLVIVAIGMLHQHDIKPEKSLQALNSHHAQQLFLANTIAPMLVAKHFLPCMAKRRRAVFAALSARVGSISDNHLGGWYSYRAAKAALNMMLKSAAIEMKRIHPERIVVGLHPGTVNSPLSKPFQHNVPKHKLFTPSYSAQCLCECLDQLTPHDSGLCFAWDGQIIDP